MNILTGLILVYLLLDGFPRIICLAFDIDFGAEIEFFYGASNRQAGDMRNLIEAKTGSPDGEVSLGQYGILIGEASRAQGEINTKPFRTPLEFAMLLAIIRWKLYRMFPSEFQPYFQNKWPFPDDDPVEYGDSARYKAIRDAARKAREEKGVFDPDFSPLYKSGYFSALQFHIRWRGYQNFFSERVLDLANRFIARGGKLDNQLAKWFDASFEEGEPTRFEKVWGWAMEIGYARAKPFGSVEEMEDHYLKLPLFISKDQGGRWQVDLQTRYQSVTEMLQTWFYGCEWSMIRPSPAVDEEEGKCPTIEQRIFRSMNLAGTFFAFLWTWWQVIKASVIYKLSLRRKPRLWRGY